METSGFHMLCPVHKDVRKGGQNAVIQGVMCHHQGTLELCC